MDGYYALQGVDILRLCCKARIPILNIYVGCVLTEVKFAEMTKVMLGDLRAQRSSYFRARGRLPDAKQAMVMTVQEFCMSHYTLIWPSIIPPYLLWELDMRAWQKRLATHGPPIWGCCAIDAPYSGPPGGMNMYEKINPFGTPDHVTIHQAQDSPIPLGDYIAAYETANTSGLKPKHLYIFYGSAYYGGPSVPQMQDNLGQFSTWLTGEGIPHTISGWLTFVDDWFAHILYRAYLSEPYPYNWYSPW